MLEDVIYILNYSKYLNPHVARIELSGIRIVNIWPSQIPKSEWIHLNIGQPDLPTPEYIKKATKEALDKDLTRYTHIMGEDYLRNEICTYLTRYHGISYETDEIFVTSGGQSAIYASLKSILSPNDNVIIPFPNYPPYINVIKYSKANVIPLKTTIDNGFDIPIDKIKMILETSDVKALLIINPGNPTGTTIPKRTQRQITQLAKDYDFLLISDEIYNRIVFDNQKYHSLAEYSGAQERTIVIQSFSKMLSMCGFRIGFIAAPKPIIDLIKVVHHTMNICASSLAQYAAYKALENHKKLEISIEKKLEISIEHIRETYNQRKKICVNLLRGCDLLQVPNPQGAFYIFPKAKNLDMTKFAKWLKLKYGVLTVPGSFFSIPTISEHNHYLRISFTTKTPLLEKGLQRICEGITRFKNGNWGK
jgi:aspartate/methionine/tyrosine aminotransferase